jgi:hypothetical protein
MLVARELWNLTSKCVGDFARNNGAGDAVPERLVQAQYIAIICMMRSIGHVLER